MTAVSQITLDDGTTSVDVDGYATLDLDQRFEPIQGGATVTRFLDGTAIKQTHYDNKKKIVIRGRGWKPPALDSIDYSLSLTLTVQTDSGTANYTVFATKPVETWIINEARAEWELTAEEV